MATDKITIQVDAEVADAYHSAAAEEQRKIQLLLRIFLREISTAPPRSLDEIWTASATAQRPADSRQNFWSPC
jgi:ferritin-like protein